MTTETMSEWGYTAKYEYACSLIKLFLERESKLDKINEDHVYSSGLIKTLFTTDYSMIINSQVKASLIKNLSTETKEQTTFDILIRLRNLYMDVYTSLGSEFMEELKKNAIAGLVALGKTLTPKVSLGFFRAEKDLKKEYASFITAYPVVLLFIIGCKDYATNLLEKRRRSLSPDIVRTNP